MRTAGVGSSSILKVILTRISYLRLQQNNCQHIINIFKKILLWGTLFRTFGTEKYHQSAPEYNNETWAIARFRDFDVPANYRKKLNVEKIFSFEIKF